MFLPDQESVTTIELGRFSSETAIKDSLTIKSDLFTEVDSVMEFIRKHINREVIITGEPRNVQRWQYPLDAIRELALNMIVHRDYTSTFDSVVKVFDERIEFYNPGALPDSITINDLLSDNYISQPRNRQIAEIFKEAGFIEKYGSGIKRVRNTLTAYGLPEPRFKSMKDGLLVTVFGKDVTENVTENVTEKREEAILDLVRNDNRITTWQIAKKLKIARMTVHRSVEKLKEKELLRRIGPDKGGYWEIIE